jgi:hypothetical protein
MAYVARFGFPIPMVHEARGTDLVMERLAGPTMLSAVMAGGLGPLEAGTLLADPHRQLHDSIKIRSSPDRQVLTNDGRRRVNCHEFPWPLTPGALRREGLANKVRWERTCGCDHDHMTN